ncbi:Mitotic spindle assembly checkpoint protein MAD1 [Sarcoptes scabiei]|uniref:Mitotic spindle assembly checkpoint protein MAD1 n=1 Tax=Sarcoptes scabiei TaxID=52283 RepID=A0A834R4V2_SARSC|nr:Mitotic spindle assembly checkpoint protein MAD1 [Sarcoptes scabiei]
MESKIPKISVGKIQPPSTISRIPNLTGIKRPSSFFPSSAVKNPIPSTGIKKPRNDLPPSRIPNTAFKRTTPLTLLRTKSRSDLEHDDLILATKLDFPDNTTPPENKAASFKASVSTLDSNTKISSLFDQNKSKESKLSSEISSSTFSKSREITKESKATSPIVNWDSINKETEIVSYKAKINLLQKELEELQSKNSRFRIDSQVNETKLRNNNEALQNKISELQKQIDDNRRKEEKMGQDYERLAQDHAEQSLKIEQNKSEYEKEISKLNENLMDLKAKEERIRSEFLLERNDLLRKNNDQMNEIERLRMENDMHNQKEYNFESKNNEIDSIKADLCEAESIIKQLQSELKSFKDGKKLEAILEGEIQQLRSTKEENIMLRNNLDLLSNVKSENVLLNEKVSGLEKSIELLTEQLRQKNIDMHDLEANRMKLKKWTEIIGIDLPELVVDKINKLEENLTMIKTENEIIISENKSFKEKALEQELRCQTLQSSLEDANRKLIKNEELLQDSERKYLFQLKMSEYYRNISTSKTPTENEENIKLSKLIDDYKEMVAKLEHQLQEEREVLKDLDSLRKENEDLQNELKLIKELNPHICMNSSMLNVSVAQTNEEQFRVMHLIDNPISHEIQKRNELIEKLKNENEKLKCLVELLERGTKTINTESIDEAVKHRFEIQKLQTSLEQSKKHFQVLKQNFKQTCDTFRMACLELTGYQIDNIAKNKYRLRHKYALHNEFIVEMDGKIIKLFRNDATKKYEEKIQQFIDEHGSYPAFFASYSLELFQSQTLF